MLRIMKSGFASAPREKILADISELCKSSRRAYLIVPEQQTVMAESLAARRLPPSSAVTFEVTNFTRLANTAFRSLGGLSGEYSDPAKKALVMWRALTELSPLLVMTSGRREVSEGLVDKTLAAVAEMQSLGIRPSDLAKCLESDSVNRDARLRGKISDLAKVYSLYKKLLGERYSDTGDDCEAMIRLLFENPDFLSDTEIFVEGFTSFTEPQYKLLGMLAKRGAVTVALTLPKAREDAFEFAEVRECEGRLVTTARREGAEIKLVREDGFAKKTNPSLIEACDRLWLSMPQNDKICLQNGDEIRIFEAQTPFEECDFVCSDIKRRVMAGASYRDFAIIARSADKYSGILDTALLKVGIPAFVSYRRDVSEFEAIKLIYTAYSAARTFSREDVMTYAKCALSGIGREECDEFEMYVNKWQINGKRFTEDGVWSMNPRGYTTRRAKDADEQLLRIHKIRERIIGPLASFARKSAAAKTAKEHAEVLLDFLLGLNVEEALDARASQLELLGERGSAEENRSLWEIICTSLDTVVEVLGDTPCGADSFLLQLKVVFSAVDIAKIPAYVDEVTVGSADMIRLFDKPHIYLIGVNAGEFPAAVSESSYFSEHDKRLLSELGLSIRPELEIKNARELYIFSRAFSYATDSVTLSYSASDTRFKAVERADVIKKVVDMCDGLSVRKISEMPIGERLYSAVVALENMDAHGDGYATVREALTDAGYAREVAIAEGRIINGEGSLGEEVLLPHKEEVLELSQTKIDSFVKCPLAYFCKYTLNLSEDELAEFDAASTGSFVHAILENFFLELDVKKKSAGALTDTEKRDLTRRAAEKYIAALGDNVATASATTKIKIDRLTRAALPVVEGLCDEFATSRFLPRFFELELTKDADDDSPAVISLRSEKGTDVLIKGTIDRVDTYKRGEDIFVRVVDYKTGKKSFEPEDIKDGRNLQMFLYLKAVIDCKKEGFLDRISRDGDGHGGEAKKYTLQPAGVIYLKTAIGDQTVSAPDDALAAEEVKRAQEREGMILRDDDVISAMGLRYTPVYSGRSPNKITESKQKYLFEKDGWIALEKNVRDSVLRVADEIRGGEISATPCKVKGEKSPCEYCKFKPICRKAEID